MRDTEFERAPDVQAILERLLRGLELPHINAYRLLCMRSRGSRAGALARIWSLPQVWQKALDIRAYYVIEVLAERFDALSQEEKEKVLIHELLHIPKSFSGALLPHSCRWARIDDRRVNALWRRYRENSAQSIAELRE
ncbi:MAG: putative metallopeptidase [Candidatus Micrarchaeia archaeon]